MGDGVEHPTSRRAGPAGRGRRPDRAVGPRAAPARRRRGAGAVAQPAAATRRSGPAPASPGCDRGRRPPASTLERPLAHRRRRRPRRAPPRSADSRPAPTSTRTCQAGRPAATVVGDRAGDVEQVEPGAGRDRRSRARPRRRPAAAPSWPAGRSAPAVAVAEPLGRSSPRSSRTRSPSTAITVRGQCGGPCRHASLVRAHRACTVSVGVAVRRHRTGVCGTTCRRCGSWPACPAPRRSSRATEAGSVRDRAITVRPSPGLLGVAHHLRHVDPHVRRQVGLVDDQHVGAGDARPALAGDVTAAGHVEHEELGVDQGRGEGGGQVVAAGLDQHHVDRGEVALEVLDGQQVLGDVVADRGVRAGTGLHRPDPLGGQHPGRAQEAGVLVGVDVVGDHRQAQLACPARGRAARSASSCRCRPGRPPRAAALAAVLGCMLRHGTAASPRVLMAAGPILRSAAPTRPGCRRPRWQLGDPRRPSARPRARRGRRPTARPSAGSNGIELQRGGDHGLDVLEADQPGHLGRARDPAAARGRADAPPRGTRPRRPVSSGQRSQTAAAVRR